MSSVLSYHFQSNSTISSPFFNIFSCILSKNFRSQKTQVVPIFWSHFYIFLVTIFTQLFEPFFLIIDRFFSYFLSVLDKNWDPFLSKIANILTVLPPVRITYQCVRITVQSVRITGHYRTVIRTRDRPGDGNETVPYIKLFKTI